MGMSIALETESHLKKELIEDENNFLYKLIGYPDSNQFPMLASIDWYGNTIFNRIQIKRLLIEWTTLFEKASTVTGREMLETVNALAMRSLEDGHQYLVFIGD